MKINTPHVRGFTLVEIMIVVAIIGLLAGMAIPNFVRARKTSLTNACISNLREIDSAKQQWALENGKKTDAIPDATEIQPYIGRGDTGTLGRVYCPLVVPGTPLAGYTINAVGVRPECQNYDVQQHSALIN